MFDSLLAVMEINKNLSPMVTELFMRRKKLNISLLLVSRYYFKGSKDIRINTEHYYFIMKIPNKRELQQITSNNSSLKIHHSSVKIS